jgi:hypothetical protein
MIADGIEQYKDLMLRQHAKQIALEHPSWGKAKCYAEAQRQHPDLTEEWPEEANPSPMPAYTPPPPGKVASSGYRYDPGAHPAPKSHIDSLRTILKDAGVWPAVQRIAAVENLDPQTAELVYGGPAKVEARKPKVDDREVFVVYASDGSVDHLELE